MTSLSRSYPVSSVPDIKPPNALISVISTQHVGIFPDQDPWQQFCTLVLMSMPDMKSYSFITSRDGDWVTVLALISFWNKQKRLTKGLTLPVVRLQTLSRRKGMLDIHYPFFKIIGWAGGDGDGADAPNPKGHVPVVV
jgi:hypothetical protein